MFTFESEESSVSPTDGSLKNVCYRQINANYYYGLFGDFRLIIDKSFEYFNATKLCLDGGKQLRYWARTKEAKKLVEFYEKEVSSEESTSDAEDLSTVRSAYYFVGGNHDASGTYVRKELLLAIGSWISLQFYHKCFRILEDYFISKYKENAKNLEANLKKVEQRTHQLKMDNMKLKKGYVKPTRKRGNDNFFLILKKNNSELYPFYILRTQKCRLNNSLGNLRKRYPDMEIIYGPKTVPNSINIHHRIKESLDYITCERNSMALMDHNEQKLIKDVDKIIEISI